MRVVVVNLHSLQELRIGWARFRECGKLSHGNRFPLIEKGSLSLLRRISSTVWKRDMIRKRTRESNFKNGKSYRESYVP